MPPVEFERLVAAVAPAAIRPQIAELLAKKRATAELGYGEPVAEINDFVVAELGRHGDSFKGQGRPDLLPRSELRDALNSIFKTALQEAWP